MSSVLLNKNHEEYLIANMRRLQYQSPPDAKAWMVTAKSLFPDDFSIQFETYKMERNYKNAKEAAQYFTELMEKFPDEPILLNEMKSMADSLSSNSPLTDEPAFIKDIFQNLSNAQKYKVLTIVASHCTEPMDHCSLMLLLLQELPSQLYQHGEKVINTLLNSEKLSRCDDPVNPYRKLLICDAMPVILSSPNFKMNPKLLFTLLQSASEFFISYIFSAPEEDTDSDFAKITKMDMNLSMKAVHKIWKPLFILMKAGGQQLQWSLVELFSSQNKFLDEMNWETIVSIIRKKLCSGDHGTVSGSSYDNSYDREVFICSAVIYFYSLYQFVKFIGPKLFFKSASTDTHYVLIEGIHALTEGDGVETVSKKFKYDRDAKKLDKNPPITVSDNIPTDVADTITRSFITSIKMWTLIHRTYGLSNEFTVLCKILQMEKWTCFQEFYIDMLLYQSRHKEAISHLMDIIQVGNDEFIKNKARLQLASCMNYIGEHVKACECLFDIICAFPYNQGIANIDIQLPSTRWTRHLTFIPFSSEMILLYCIELLICIYKKKLKIGVKESVMLGHIVVLSQYRWPREEEFFLQCIRTIQMSESFCYGRFFDYVVVPGILEEFMFLTTPDGGSVTLDLLPSSTTQIGKQRAVTRGVNKGAKEDLRENMKKQMFRCEENLNEIFVTFIQQEYYCIKRIIM